MFLHIPDGAIFFPLHSMFFLFFLFLTKQALPRIVIFFSYDFYVWLSSIL